MPDLQDKQKKLILSRQKVLEKDKSKYNEILQDIADYICPHREDIYNTLARGERKGKKIFDGTAVGAAVLATDGIHGYHVSPAFPWFKYSMNRKQANKVVAIREWLDEIEYNLYMALTRSNFYAEMWPFIYDGLTIGTADFTAEEDLSQDRIIFEAVHPGEIYIEENRYGEVDLMHRKRKMTARKIWQMFGEETVLPQPVKQAYENNPFEEFEVIHAVFPREEFDTRKLDSKNKRYASFWLLLMGQDGAHVCRESGFDKFPHNVWRYLKNGKEVYGFSPGHLAMSDVKGLNLMNKTLLGAAQMAIDPPYTIPSYLEGKVQLKPRGINPVTNYQDRILPVTTGLNYPVGIDREQAKQKAIHDRYHVDTFLMLGSLEGSKERTRYEVQQMMKEKAAVLGAELGPLNNTLDDILETVYEIESKAGRLPKPPQVLYDLAEQDKELRFDPVYMGPLAQAQREAFAKDGVLNFLDDITPIVNVKPDVLDLIDTDAMVRHFADVDGVPALLIKSEEQVASFRDKQMQVQMAEQEKEDMERLAAGAKDLAAADKQSGGSISETIQSGLNAL